MNAHERQNALEVLRLDGGRITDDELQEELDEAVHDSKSHEATEINNKGAAYQVAYLKLP